MAKQPATVRIRSIPLEIIQAMCGEPCPKCKGKGSWEDTTYDRAGADTPCETCQGTGRKLPTTDELMQMVIDRDTRIATQAMSIQAGLRRVDELKSQHQQATADRSVIDNDVLDVIRKLIVATRLIEDEGSTMGMVSSICDLAVQRCKDVRAINAMRDQLKGVNELQLARIDALQSRADENSRNMHRVPTDHAHQAAFGRGVINRAQGPCECQLCLSMRRLNARLDELGVERPVSEKPPQQ